MYQIKTTEISADIKQMFQPVNDAWLAFFDNSITYKHISWTALYGDDVWLFINLQYIWSLIADKYTLAFESTVENMDIYTIEDTLKMVKLSQTSLS